MRYRMAAATAALLLALLTTAGALAISIPDREVNRQKIYVGNPTDFSTPAEVDYSAVVHKTPEYGEIVAEKLERGTGKYWILLSQASDKALNAISKTATDEKYDLVAEKGYLASLDTPVNCTDITTFVIEQL